MYPTPGPLRDQVEMDLRSQQEACYTKVDDSFLIKYINIYEYAVVKYLHLFKVGEKVVDSDSSTPPITAFIMQLPRHQEDLGIHTLITPSELPTGREEEVRKSVAAWNTLRNDININDSDESVK